jgi:hypothetical protein|uniref:DUF1134 domain-containing protein n=1 Tax=Altererythrobacter segetis TaxID=1104773 RepID=UPI001408B77F|nr:DUF1134 domain-containing protein [Altererythrobacter segetis]
MLIRLAAHCRRPLYAVGLALAATAGPAPLAAQEIQAIDPNKAIDSDLAPPPPADGYQDPGQTAPQAPPSEATPPEPGFGEAAPATSSAPLQAATTTDPSETYKEDDLIGAAEGVFGKGAEGVAKMIQGILKKQGQPNGYIVGREAGGAIAVGLRYGSGTLYHKVEGQMPVYWTGPSIGFDLGANAGSTFVLVYNLYDTDQLYERYPAGEGDAYVVGGLTASYMRKGNVVLIPIRVGAGLRLGANVGYMKFSKKQRWLPF